MMIIELLKDIFSVFFEVSVQSAEPESLSEPIRFYGMKLINGEDLVKLLIRFFVNFIFVLILVRGVYYPVQKRKDFLFAYITLSMIIFLLCYMLIEVDIKTGFALGLFAIFGIIRYRTDAIPIKEMTYLFIAIGISVLNALSVKKISYAELAFANCIIVAATYGLERVWLLRHEAKKMITYEKIELVHSANHEALHSDLENRTGIKINRFEIGKIDFLRDTANIVIYFYEDDQVAHTESQ